jgi:tetratricopeptide (TPR) repeat protein
MANENIEIQDLSTEEIKDKTTELFEANKNIIYGLAGLVVVVILGFYWYKFQYQAPRIEKANKEIYKADQMMERDSFSLALNGVPGSSIGYTGVIEKYSGTPAANMAHYKAGAALLRMGEHEKALIFLKEYSGAEELQTQAYNMMGDAASSLSKFDEGLGYYERAANNTSNLSLKMYSWYKAGKLLEHQGKNEEAKGFYTKIMENDSKAAERLGVEKDLIRLAQ